MCRCGQDYIGSEGLQLIEGDKHTCSGVLHWGSAEWWKTCWFWCCHPVRHQGPFSKGWVRTFHAFRLYSGTLLLLSPIHKAVLTGLCFFVRDPLHRIMIFFSFFFNVLKEGGLSPGWPFIRLVSAEWSLIRVVSHQGGISSRWSIIRWSVIRVVSHQVGLSSGWSFIMWSVTRLVFQQGGLL